MSTIPLVPIEQRAFTIRATPPSMNTKEAKGHWTVTGPLKKDWQAQLVVALNELDMPRRAFLAPLEDPPTRLYVDATFVRPPKGGYSLDAENARGGPGGFSKTMGDALTGRHGSTPGMGRKRSLQDKADRAFWLPVGARIRCGWMVDDGGEHWDLRTQVLTGHSGCLPETRVRIAWFAGEQPPCVATGWDALALERGEVSWEQVAHFLAPFA